MDFEGRIGFFKNPLISPGFTSHQILMKVIRDFPPLRNKHVWIPMTDGCRLSARIWRPKDSHQNPVPAILEYIPYRKNDGTALRDSLIHPYFADNGYAAVRVDLRAAEIQRESSRGNILQQELEDGIEVLEWISCAKPV